MTGSCPRSDDLLRLSDGELTENDAQTLRSHVASCAPCREETAKVSKLIERLGAPASQPARPEALPELMLRIDALERAGAERAPARAEWRRHVLFEGLAVAAAGAAAALLLVMPKGEAPQDPGTFSARRAVLEAALAREVGIDLFALRPSPRRLRGGAALRKKDAALVTAYRNLGRDPVFLLVFAVDRAGALHWIQPGYGSSGEDPASVRLPPSAGQSFLPEGVGLEDPAPGPLRLFTLVSRSPLHVSALERLPADQLVLGALRSRFPAAQVDELDVQLQDR